MVSEILKLDPIFLKIENTSYAYLKIVEGKLPYRSVTAFLQHSGVTRSQVARIIHVSERAIHHCSPNKLMNINASERLLLLTRLFIKGTEVFNEKEKFIAWINRPRKYLAFSKPVDLMETTLGMGLVLDELLRIEHGVFS